MTSPYYGDGSSNYFDVNTNRWTDMKTNNWYDGQSWHNPSGQTLDPNTGIWRTPIAAAGSPGISNGGGVNPYTFQPTPNYGTGMPAQQNNGAYQTVPGSTYKIMDLANQYSQVLNTQQYGYTSQLQQQQGQLAQQLAAQQADAQRQLANIQAQHQMELQRAHDDWASQQQQIQNAYDGQQKEAERQLQQRLASGQISNQQFMQARDLAQKESEFARTQALNEAQQKFQQNMDTLKFQHDSQLQNAQLSINALAEARQERELQANLAANPKDTVAYEYYKRGLGEPGQANNSDQGTASKSAWDLAQKFANGGTATPASGASVDMTGDARIVNNDMAAGGTPGGNFSVPSNAETNPAGYPSAPPAYSNQTMQGMVAGITGQQPAYNPNLGGTGAFGANIVSPNQISRAQSQSMSPTDVGVLTSFLNAGVDTGNGKRTSINPDDYFAQMSKSFIPTLAGGSSPGTDYSLGAGNSPAFMMGSMFNA